MAETIEDTLKELDRWYNELPGGNDRPKLLSRLATLELCGWLEECFDNIALKAATALAVHSSDRVGDALKYTSGFEYANHFRRMLVAIGGELLVSRTEHAIEMAHNGALDTLRSNLGSLWTVRCELAHKDSTAPNIKQITVQAPSWALNQHRVLSKLIIKYEIELTAQVTRLNRP